MTLTVELPDEEAKAHAQGVSTQQYAQEILRRELDNPAKRPLSARIRELWSDMPPDVRSKLPADGASQIDHYVYALPKKKP